MLKCVYIASPYTYKGRFKKVLGRFVEWFRFWQIAYYHGIIIEKYKVAGYGPILESHLLVAVGKLTRSGLGKSSGVWADWREYDLTMISKCEEVWVVMMPDWGKSTGVLAEIRFAKKNGIPVKYFDTKTQELRETPKGEVANVG